METVTYKTYLKTPKPYLTANIVEYLQMLKAKKDNLYFGNTGIYLNREIRIENQKLFFLFLDIDGDKNLTGDALIQSAIQNMDLTYRVLKALEVENYFKFIATGGRGFRVVSNLLFNRDDYKAFVEFIRLEMPHIHDIQPTEDLDVPHQLLSYKGNPKQTNRSPVDRHSVVIPNSILDQNLMTVADYKEITQGKPDPNLFIEFMQSFFNFRQIIDLAALNGFGDKLKEYRNLNDLFHVNTFEFIKTKKSKAPIALEVMHKMLKEKGIHSKIAYKGKKLAISFDGLPCPSCGKTTGNASAYPPNYKLKCFSSNCDADREKGGLFLQEWSGIKSGETLDESKPASPPLIISPKSFVSRSQAHEMIQTELTSPDNSLLLITPGVGKTHMTMEYLAQPGTDNKIIIYSSYNKKLQQDSFQKAKKFSLNPDKFFLLKSKMDLCKIPHRLQEVTLRGFSPADILCSKCEYRSDCSYFDQRKDLGPGVYFVTHKMLQYLENIFPNPDLLILDENILSGFLDENICLESEMRTLYSVLNKIDFQFIKQIIDLGHSIGDPIRGSQSHPLLVNGRKLTDSEYNEDTVISLLATLMDKNEDDIIKKIRNLVLKIKNHKKTELYNKGVNLKAFYWLKGLIRPDKFSLLFITSQGKLLFKTKSIIPLKYHKTPVKILDATGNEKILSAILKRAIKTVQADVEWNSHKTHIVVNTSGNYIKNDTDEGLRKLLTRMIDKISSEKVMVITYKDIKKRVLKLCEQIDPSKSFMDYHFIGRRGTNEFETCGAVLVLGLPYPNLNDSGHDAFILFPDKKDADIRDDWVISTMQWELLQNIHRTRPVNKSSVEIVIASSFWPPILGKPDIKDESSTKSYNWKDIAISKLDPFVKEFGFFNADIGFLAGVFVETKEKAADNFKRNLKDLLYAHNYLKKLNSENSQLYFGRDINISPDNDLMTSTIEKWEYILIFVIRNIYYNNLVSTEGIIPEILSSNFFVKDLISHRDNKILSNSTQLTELIIYFKEKYPHFEPFELKLSHSRGHYTKGIGTKKKVSDFYNELNAYEIFGNTPVDSYKTNISSIKIDPIPEGYVVFYVPDKNSVLVYMGEKDNLLPVNIENGLTEFKNIFDGKQIITNNGKYLASKLMEHDSPFGNDIKITDIVLNEKIISNGIVEVKQIDLPYVYEKYGFNKDPDITLGVHQIFDSWIEQDKIIKEFKLREIIDLESQLIWVTAKIEVAGIEIDSVRILSYQESVQASIVKVEQEIRKLIPSKISLNNMAKIKGFINKTFRTNLLSINKDAINTVSDIRVKNLITQIVEYNRLVKANRDINNYINLASAGDYRVRDEIQQINTKTGRFYRPLQTVKRKGPMRSFFKAAPGYKLVKADYSQQEVRIIAGLAEDQNLIDIFKSGKDIYVEVAKFIFKGSSLDPSVQRKIAKEIVVGINNGRTEYSIHPKLIKSGLRVSLQEVQGFIIHYMRSFPDLFEWRKKTVIESRKNGYVVTGMGRRMVVTNSTDSNSIVNFPVQGTGSDGFKDALCELDGKLRDLDARIVHILHDEIIVEARADIAWQVSGILKGCMEQAFLDILPEVPMLAEPDIRDAWGNTLPLQILSFRVN